MKKNKIIALVCFIASIANTYAAQKIVDLWPYESKTVWIYKIINNTNKTIMAPYTDSNSKVLWNYINSNNNHIKSFNFWQPLDKIYNLWSFTIRNVQCRNVTVRYRQRYKSRYVRKWLVKFNTLPGHWNWTWTQTWPYKCVAWRQYKTRYSSRCQSYGYPATRFIPWASRTAYDSTCKDTITLYRRSYDCDLTYYRTYRRAQKTTRVCN